MRAAAAHAAVRGHPGLRAGAPPLCAARRPLLVLPVLGPAAPGAVLYVCLARLSSSVSSSANPVIYFLVGTRRGQGLLESLRAMLRRVLWDTLELEGKETPSSYTNEVRG